MKVGIVGAGPAGLFFSLRLKQVNPQADVTVFERSSADKTYGFGVGFSEGALKFVAKACPDVGDDISHTSIRQTSLSIVHQGEKVSVGGNVFYGISRVRLLQSLADRARSLGVEIHENSAVQSLDPFKKFDLVVGADGVGSIVRRLNESSYQTEVLQCKNMWIWYATSHVTDGIEIVFQQTPFGLFIGHTYQYEANKNTFVVECSPQTWISAGLDRMNGRESLHFCSKLFIDYLCGKPLIGRDSEWFTPKLIKTGAWHTRNTVLLGDALKTMHPTIGSGTRAAMQDADALALALGKTDCERIPDALDEFELQHKSKADALQASAVRSIDWYENIEESLGLSPLELTSLYMKRTGKIDRARLQKMDPAFLAVCDAQGIVN